MPLAYTGEIAALITSLLFSIGPTYFTLAGQRVGSVIVNRVRLLLAVLFLAITHWIVYGQPLPLSATPESWFWLGLSGLIGLALGDAALFQAFVVLGTRLTMLVFSLSPVISAGVAWLFLGETLSAVQILGIAVTLGGILMVVLQRGNHSTRPRDKRQYLIGLLLALLGAIGQALGLITAKKGLGASFPALSGQVIRMAAGAAAIWLIPLLRGKVAITVKSLREQPRAFRHIVIATLVGPFAGVFFSLVAVQFAPVGIASTLMSLPPIFLLPISYFVFKERFGWQVILGTIVALLGVGILFLA
jgi:drug/metabolite transporter (DMT)-like permease